MSSQFKYLFTPLKIGSVTVKNRIVLVAVKPGYDDTYDNYSLPNERYARYYAERAKGGAGLLVTGFQMVHPTSSGGPAGYRKEIVPRYKMLADMVHEHGGTIFGQIAHTGIMADGELIDDYHQVWGPSAVRGLNYTHTPKAMEAEDIKEVIAGFAQVAAHIKEAGLDGVELHSAHGYLLWQFLSPISNRRDDEYGGNFENRMRFLLETIDAVRESVGPDFPLGVRISGDEFATGGLSLEDIKAIAQRLEATRKIDYINVSAGAYWGLMGSVLPMSIPVGSIVYLAAGIREVVTIPVFCVGRIAHPVMAEQILANGQADMVGMGRALVCDPELPNKAREGRLDDIRYCMYCNQGCRYRVLFKRLALTCIQNPAAGREKRLGIGTLEPARVTKRVMVIGGGPAGLKAAEILARRQHEVVLYEKEQELGGQVKLAAKLPLHQEMEECIRYLVTQVRKLGLSIKTGVEVNASLVRQINPDMVVVATGSRPLPTIFVSSRLVEDGVPGVNQPNVVTIPEILGERIRLGQRVVIIDDDGTQRTWGIAEWLADRGKEVELITGRQGVESIRLNMRWIDEFCINRLVEKGVKITTSAEIKEISEDKVIFLDKRSKTERKIEAVDNVVWVGNTKADDGLYFELKQLGIPVRRIGDCVAPRSIDYAIWEGEEVGRAL